MIAKEKKTENKYYTSLLPIPSHGIHRELIEILFSQTHPPLLPPARESGNISFSWSSDQDKKKIHFCSKPSLRESGNATWQPECDSKQGTLKWR